GGVYMHQRKRRLARGESLHGQVQHDRGGFTDGVEHHRVIKLGGQFTNNMNRFRLKLLEVGFLWGFYSHYSSIYLLSHVIYARTWKENPKPLSLLSFFRVLPCIPWQQKISQPKTQPFRQQPHPAAPPASR